MVQKWAHRGAGALAIFSNGLPIFPFGKSGPVPRQVFPNKPADETVAAPNLPAVALVKVEMGWSVFTFPFGVTPTVGA